MPAFTRYGPYDLTTTYPRYVTECGLRCLFHVDCCYHVDLLPDYRYDPVVPLITRCCYLITLLRCDGDLRHFLPIVRFYPVDYVVGVVTTLHYTYIDTRYVALLVIRDGISDLLTPVPYPII